MHYTDKLDVILIRTPYNQSSRIAINYSNFQQNPVRYNINTIK